MAIDAMKILGSLLNSGALSRGSGSNVLGSVLGSVLGGGTSGAAHSGGGLGDMLGGLLGGGSSSGGGMADMLGGLLGGGKSGSGMDLGALLGMAMKQFGGSSGAMGLADFDAPEPEQANQQATVMIRAMIYAARADGRVDDEEQRHIIEGLGEDITPEEMAFVQDELNAPMDVDAFARDVPDGMAGQVYLASLMAIDLDTNPEAQYLHQLAQGLGMSPEAVNAIHDQLQVPRLYS
ncbi:tellurite resistance TerB family protein [Thiolapillus sp.]